LDVYEKQDIKMLPQKKKDKKISRTSKNEGLAAQQSLL